jgi:signal transduction histidine kinase
MKSVVSNWIKSHRFGRLLTRWMERLVEVLKIPPPETPQMIRRITIMERNIVLPIKVAGIAMILHSFYFSPWFGIVLTELDIAIEYTRAFLLVYISFNVLLSCIILAINRVPLALVEWAVFIGSLMDGIFLAALTLFTGGFDSILYWLFLALIVRSAVSVPRATSQLMLNLTLSVYYVLAGAIDINIAQNLADHRGFGGVLMEVPDNPTEPLLLRLILLVLMTLCCYAVQVLLEKQRQAEEEAREFGMREGQLQSAGRLAAEFVHQMKNPLAIINNAAFSLQRALKEGRGATEQVRIIQEEVERSDRIITQVMGYAQLSEGRVEKLSVTEELDRAIAQVFPNGTQYQVQLHRDYSSSFPPLMMLRRHVSDTLVNLLQNAREALDGKDGNVYVQARLLKDFSTEISIADDGPGIPPDKREKIFEAYYTTKEKGTGLGLATVKHNVEIYGGRVRVESELGKGTRFILLFPARALMRFDRQN